MESSLKFETVVFEEDGFSIRWGVSAYFMQHDLCYDLHASDGLPRGGIAHDSYYDGTIAHSGGCRTCGVCYSETMGGFIQLLNWER